MANKKQKSINLLPEFFRTDKNNKFLSGTIDQLIQTPKLERIDGYVGSKLTLTYNSTSDVYIPEVSDLRKNYQLTPALVTNDEDYNVKKSIGIDDLTNEISIQGGIANNFDKLYSPNYYAYDPHIDLDKLINYQEYYWLTTGPDTIVITGSPKNSTSTYVVNDAGLNSAFIFTPDGSTQNPLIKLYRNNVYNFQCTLNNKFYIKTAPSLGNNDLYTVGVTNNGISTGTVSLIVDNTTPDVLYYATDDEGINIGQMLIRQSTEDTEINVEEEILGKVNYTSGTGVSLSNGMKIRFGGSVLPEKYQGKEYFVEGVGKSIVLIDYDLLISNQIISNQLDDDFDVSNFDEYPFDNFKRLPVNAEYITINRASEDVNPWTRYNRWVHKDIIKISAELNNLVPVYPYNLRAKRPIIEFNANIKLYNFGTKNIGSIDLIDNTTKNAFRYVENSAGYYVDGILLQQGHRVIFNADEDPSVKGKVYKVEYSNIGGSLKLNLTEDTAYIIENESSILVNFGNENESTDWWYNGQQWVYAQQHNKLNESPLFDLFDVSGLRYSDTSLYSTNFNGNKIFGYSEGPYYDKILGFSVNQENSQGIGSFLFTNYFTSGEILVSKNNLETEKISTAKTFIKVNNEFKNVWTESENYRIPIIQLTSLINNTSTVEINAIDNPILSLFTFDVFIKVTNGSIELFNKTFSGVKKVSNENYSTVVINGKYCVVFDQELPAQTDVIFKIYSDNPPNKNGYYEVPLGLTNNPLNDNISSFTLSDLTDHLQTMVNRVENFSGDFPGSNNLRDLNNFTKFGTRLISHQTPLAFSSMFVSNNNYSVIKSIETVADHYNNFKSLFLKKITEYNNQVDIVSGVDTILLEINQDKNLRSSYFYSDMIPYGSNKNRITINISNLFNTIYPINFDFNLKQLSLKSVLVYKNNVQLIANLDYQFIDNDASIEFLTELSIGDVIYIDEYPTTEGCYVPPTPSKLGLYPSWRPTKFVDNTYADGAVQALRCHDGSIMLAFNDYRDDMILELEKRIYNNIKVGYKQDLFDINSVIPGYFRDTEYSLDEINSILKRDFVKWVGIFGIEYTNNDTFDKNNTKTYNYNGSWNPTLGLKLSGYWRNIYQYIYGTDSPGVTPWEMLGFNEKPSWWELEYGPVPYTSGNEILWNDIKDGYVRQGPRQGYHSLYARPLLLDVLPVDEFGNLKNPDFLAINFTDNSIREKFIFGDIGPTENTWRRSSYFPFAIQRLLALTNPVSYSSLMFDVSRMHKNLANQWVYSETNEFLNLKNIIVPENEILTSGFSVFVTETYTSKNNNFVQDFKNDLKYLDFNLMYKVGGFINKNKLQVIIDAFDPTSVSPGALLPLEDYRLTLNTSNPVSSVAISGIIIQKSNGKYKIKGYDRYNSYFNIYKPIRNSTTPTVAIGGISESYVTWAPGTSGGNTGLSSAEITTAIPATAGVFYQKGQIVLYGNKFYIVKVSHRAGPTFESSLFTKIDSLPIIGGVTVQLASAYETQATQIPYGTEFSSVQDVYDFIIGYGKWLEDQGFIFDDFNSEINELLNWNFSAKEFLYWTTQNWADNSIITLSPFAYKIKFFRPYTIVDDIFNSFYEYSILQANGDPISKERISVNRDEGFCTITITEGSDGIYFVLLNNIQKEHAMIFNNRTIFNDSIFDLESGYRQLRMKLVGFKTKEWNGDYFSPGFVFDEATILNWKEFKNYQYADVVKFNGKYYSAKNSIFGSDTFDVNDGWILLGEKPVADLIPNFDYKINQFEDFYSLDIDNFDQEQQKLAQHLIGYTPRTYLNNIFSNPISQYKFYQGYIRDKGTKNSIQKLAKATINNLQGEVDYFEEWAFRVGNFGSYQTYKEFEFTLNEGTFIENPQVVNIVDVKPVIPNDLISYIEPDKFAIKPPDFDPTNVFKTINSTYQDNNFVLSTAGYVRIDDVDSTAYNENSLLDIAQNQNINEGDIIWLGFKQNGDWDVLRYEKSISNVIGVFVSSPASEITFVTDLFHNLNVGDIISITKFNDQVNGVYTVLSIPSLDRFIVASELASIENAELPSPGQLFKFSRARTDHFDSLPDDKQLIKLPYGSKFWIDSDIKNGNGKWAVYQKINNYSEYKISATNFPANQGLGFNIYKEKNNNLLFLSASLYSNVDTIGRILVYDVSDIEQRLIFGYPINNNPSNSIRYHESSTETNFGKSLIYDSYQFNNTGYGLIFAGAPDAGQVRSASLAGGVRFSTGTESPSVLVSEGLFKISSIDPLLEEEKGEYVLLSPNPSSYQKFGYSAFVQKNTGTKLLLVGAPGTVTTGSGIVYSYNVNCTGSNVSVTYNQSITTSSVYVGSLWGSSIVGIDDGSLIAISAPGNNASVGFVCVYSGTNFSQTIDGSDYDVDVGSNFGQSLAISDDGSYLMVSAPGQKNIDQSFGRVFVFEKSTVTNQYLYSQTLFNPYSGAGMKFGTSLSINHDNNELVVGAVGYNYSIKTTFDNEKTTYDAKSTTFIGTAENAGNVYVYNRRDERFVVADELPPLVQASGSYYGTSVLVDNDIVYIGSPALNSNTTSSGCYKFIKIDSEKNSWDQLRLQDELVDLSQFRRVSMIDTFKDEVIEYLDIIDPVKGKIAGLADQEIKYRTSYDPAIYSIGTAGTVNDTNINWLDEHIGELWWDLSTVKYQWYEQGDLTYRKNNWGNLFPGATIDVYEWVGSFYLPSEWSALADTAEGLVENISGQPKYADNSVISVKQIYNSVTNSFSNYYYFWVKNKITIPNVKNRRISSFQVSSLIADPVSYGYKSAYFISKDSVALSNIGTMLVDDRINLNIAVDVINNSIGRHTEWLLLKEGAADSVPPVLLEKKLIDSLLGRDKLGNLVPDPLLTERTKYGIEIRPRQTLFKDRKQALRNLIEFSNSILLKNQITGNYDFRNLEQQEIYPDITSNEYDEIVDDNELLSIIQTYQLRPAKLSCTVYNGKIHSVSIIDSGFGYKRPPTVTLSGNVEVPAVIETSINEQGKVVGVAIVNPGSGYVQVPSLAVRSYAVIVKNDETYNGKWTKFVWNHDTDEWERKQTQKFNTPLYWKYVDWQHSDYNQYKDYTYTVNEVYQLLTLSDLNEGDYVKVKNGGDNRYLILSKIAPGSVGTFDDEFDLVYKENGTIQILDTIWSSINGELGFDGSSSAFDQTLYDQTPDIELSYITTALVKDIFVGELKVNWNLFFFKAVKYALSEQKLLDWAFKTSFINVVNYAGTLDQRPVYKLQNSSYYEDYIKEVKPYHTQIRSYTTNYDLLDQTRSYTTDFDLPAYYDKTTNEYKVVNENDPLLAQYPWKSWFDNYTFEIGSIRVGKAGENYKSPPNVIIQTAAGDSGSGATAQAYITSGKVTEIKVLTSGENYKKPPMVILQAPEDDNLVPAVAYAVLTNKKVRSNLISLKFDRISRQNEIFELEVIDRFSCNGSNNEFVLSWLAAPDKSKIVVTLNNDYVLSSNYTVQYYTEIVNGYNKKMSKLVFLKDVPESDKILTVRYEKNNQLFSAVERILTYYNPTSGMPGKDLEQLIDNFEYPNTSLITLDFGYSVAWDYQYNNDEYIPFGVSSYADNVGFYTSITATSTVTNIGSSLSSMTLSTLVGVAVGQHVNIISTLSNVFSTSTVKVVSIQTASNSITLNSTVTTFVNTGSIVEFWNYDSNSALLDTLVEGGTWNANGNISALGVNPSDIILDGDMFVTPSNSNILDELVPGHTADSIALNVYTKNKGGAPVIINNYFYINANEITYHKLNVLPTSEASIKVVLNNRLLEYVPYTSFVNTPIDADVFTFDEDNLIVGSQSTAGVVGYSIVSVGGLNYGVQLSSIDGASLTTYEETAVVKSLSDIQSVGTASVYVNGSNPIIRKPLGFHNTNTSYTQVYYELGPASSTDQRAAVHVYNLTQSPSTIVAWFMGTEYNSFNEIRSEEFSGNDYQSQDTSTDGSIPTYYYSLTNVPGKIEPIVNQVIVEINSGTGWKILTPPVVTYYNVTDPSILVYKIDSKRTWGPADDGFTNLSNVRVYRNGKEMLQGIEYNLLFQSSINITPTVLNSGDVLAIVGKPDLTYDLNAYDYDIIGNNLKLVVNPTNTSIRVTTYTNHDNLSFNRDNFIGNPNRRFKVSQPVLNDNYLWVTLNGVPLINKIDYEILDDQLTIQLSDTFNITSNDKIQAISIGSQPLASTVLGYRIFNDIFGRSHYKRLSKKNSTFLTQPLYADDVEIYVNDSTVLTPPSPTKNIPGIVLIDGERIEFNKIEGNVLKNIRRATLGTGASEFVDINSKVIDQSPEQTIPFSDVIKRQVIFVNTTTNTYAISTSSFISPAPNDATNLISSDGITFQNSPVNISVGAVNPKDQIVVLYGGRPLRKEGMYYHDISVAYDSPEYTSILGYYENSQLLPANATKGDAYLITGTNQVWIQENSIEVGSVNGFVYKGLNYSPPEFTLTVSTSTQNITLNVDLKDNVKLVIMKKEFATTNIWNDIVNTTETLSLFDSTTMPAIFLKEKSAELPDKYYFGGNSS
jgi:hypothetical protein